MRYRRTLIAPVRSSCMISKKKEKNHNHITPLPGTAGARRGFYWGRFIGWQGIYRRKRRSNLSGGEGSGVASNANVSVCKREYGKCLGAEVLTSMVVSLVMLERFRDTAPATVTL